jgi:hypothetical protein
VFFFIEEITGDRENYIMRPPYNEYCSLSVIIRSGSRNMDSFIVEMKTAY